MLPPTIKADLRSYSNNSSRWQNFKKLQYGISTHWWCLGKGGMHTEAPWAWRWPRSPSGPAAGPSRGSTRTSHTAHRARYGILRQKSLFLPAFKFALPETVILQCLWLPVQKRGSINNSKWMCVTGMHTQTRVSLCEINSKWVRPHGYSRRDSYQPAGKTSTRSQGTSILFFAVSSVS